MSYPRCPAGKAGITCTEGQDFGPCPDCELDDQMANAMRGVPLPDYATAQGHRVAGEIRKLQAAVKSLSAAQRRSGK